MALSFLFKAHRDTTSQFFYSAGIILSEMANYEIISEVYITVQKKRQRLCELKLHCSWRGYRSVPGVVLMKSLLFQFRSRRRGTGLGHWLKRDLDDFQTGE